MTIADFYRRQDAILAKYIPDAKQRLVAKNELNELRVRYEEARLRFVKEVCEGREKV